MNYHIHQDPGKGSREGLGGFGTKSGQVQQGFGKCLVPEKMVTKVWEVWVQREVRFNRVLDKNGLKIFRKRFQEAVMQSQGRGSQAK